MTAPDHIDSPDADIDEQIGQFLRRGNRWWIAPPRTTLPDLDTEPAAPWTVVDVRLPDNL